MPMKIVRLCALAFVCAVSGVVAQDSKVPDANPNSTVITSDLFKLDMTKREGVFTTNVVVTSQDMKLKADELTVYFAAGSAEKIERIMARGNVVIEQPERTAHANQVEYFVSEDRMVLSGTPDILQKNGNHISGSSISIYRSSNRMDVDGRSRMVLFTDLSATPNSGTSGSK